MLGLASKFFSLMLLALLGESYSALVLDVVISDHLHADGGGGSGSKLTAIPTEHVHHQDTTKAGSSASGRRLRGLGSVAKASAPAPASTAAGAEVDEGGGLAGGRVVAVSEESANSATDLVPTTATDDGHGHDVDGGGDGDGDAVWNRRANRLVSVRSMRVQVGTCPDGYFGATCSECATGFFEGEEEGGDGTTCEAASSPCSTGNGVRAILLMIVAFCLLLLTLDALWNGKSPKGRWSQLLSCGSGGGGGHRGGNTSTDFSSRTSFATVIALSHCSGSTRTVLATTNRGGAGAHSSSGQGWGGRTSLGRLCEGIFIFISTAQIITQESEVLELEFPLAMRRVLAALQWTNLDPQSVFGSCVISPWRFLDRVNGSVEALSTSLIVLLMSFGCARLKEHLMGKRVPAGHKEEQAGGEGGETSQEQDWGGEGQQKAEAGAASAKTSVAGFHGDSGGGGGAWERWCCWSYLERHTCVAVLVCLLTYPVVCTTLLRVFDCREESGSDVSWLRADTTVECSSDQHRTYRVLAAVFLALFGFGIPAALVGIVLWAKGGDPVGETNAAAGDAPAPSSKYDDDDDDAGDTTVAVRRVRRAPHSSPGAAGERQADEEGFREDKYAEVSREAATSSSGEAATSSETLSWGDAGGREAGSGEVFTRSSDYYNSRAGGGDCYSTHPHRGCGFGWAINHIARRLSGSCVVAIRKTMPPPAEHSFQQSSQMNRRWRSTIPLWSPYRDGRHWFAAWELGRRLALTGLLTAVSPDVAGKEFRRAVVACALAVVTLVVAEMVRPHKDPWICWIYRLGGIAVFLTTLAGVLQKVDSTSATTYLVGAVISLVSAMIVCACGGWRASCVEQEGQVVDDDPPRGEDSGWDSGGCPLQACPFLFSSSRRESSAGVGPRVSENRAPTESGAGGRKRDHDGSSEHRRSKNRGNRRARQTTASGDGSSGGSDVSNGSSSSGRRGDDGVGHTASDRGVARRLSSASHKKIGDGDSNALGLGVGVVSSSPVSTVPIRTGKNAWGAPVFVVNPMFSSNATGTSEGGSGGPGDEINRPRGGSSGSGGGGGGWEDYAGPSGRGGHARAAMTSHVFDSVSGAGSMSMKFSIDSHLNSSSGGRMVPRSEAPVVSMGSEVAEMASSVGVADGKMRGPSSSSTPGGRPPLFSRTESTARLKPGNSNSAAAKAPKPAPEENEEAAAKVAAAAPPAGRPVLAPGAPMFDEHRARFVMGRSTRSPSSFASTSFASTSFESTEGSRKRRNDRVLAMTSWRKSASARSSLSATSRMGSWISSFGAEGSPCDSLVDGPPSDEGSGIRRSRIERVPGWGRDSSLGRGRRSASMIVSSGGRMEILAARGRKTRPKSMTGPRVSGAAATALRAAHSLLISSGDVNQVSEDSDGQNPIIGDTSNLRKNWVPPHRTKRSWSVDLPGSSAMPRWWGSDNDPFAGVPPDLVLAAAERAKAAEREDAAARVEAVFGDEIHRNDLQFSSGDGRSNIVDFRAFVRAGEYGTSSFDSRTRRAEQRARARRYSWAGEIGRHDGDSGGGEVEGSIDSDVGGLFAPGGPGFIGYGIGERPSAAMHRSASLSPRTTSSLTSAEFTQYLSHDFEDEEDSVADEDL